MIDDSDVVIDESRKNNFLSLKDKAEILERLENGEMAASLAREYGTHSFLLHIYFQK